jgi:hypothetical protein
LLHQQLRMTSVISSLRRMLLNWPTAGKYPSNTRNAARSLPGRCDIYTVARIIAPLAPPDDDDYRHRAFWQRLRYFCRLYLASSRWLAP